MMHGTTNIKLLSVSLYGVLRVYSGILPSQVDIFRLYLARHSQWSS